MSFCEVTPAEEQNILFHFVKWLNWQNSFRSTGTQVSADESLVTIYENQILLESTVTRQDRELA